MRRSDREIKDFEEMLEVIKKCDVCRLGLHDEDYPYIVPLNFGMEVKDGQVVFYFHGATEGRKFDLMKKDNRASFEMDCSHRLVTDEESGNCTMEYECVMGHGRVELLTEEEKYDALCILMKQYRSEDFPFNQKIIPNTNVWKLTVEGMTGKRRMKK